MEYIKSFSEFINEKNESEAFDADVQFILESLGSMAGMPKSLVKDIVRKGGGQNSSFSTDVQGGKNLRKVLKHLDDSNNIGIIARTPTGEFAYALIKNSYDWGKGKGLTFYVDDQLQDLLNIGSLSKDKPRVKNNIYTEYKYQYPKYKWRGGRQVKWSGGYYNEHTRMTASNLKDWLPLGEFDLSIIQKDPQRAELQQQRTANREGIGKDTRGGVSVETVKKYMSSKFVSNVVSDIDMLKKRMNTLVDAIDDPDKFTTSLNEINDIIDKLKEHGKAITDLESFMKYGLDAKDGRVDIGNIVSKGKSNRSWHKRDYDEIINILKQGHR